MAVHPFKTGLLTTTVAGPAGYTLDPKTVYSGPRPHQPIQQVGSDYAATYYDDYYTTQDSLERFQDMPPDHIQHIIRLVASLENTTSVDLGAPHLRPIYRSQGLLGFVLLLYSVLVLSGLVANLLILAVIITRRLYTDPVQACVLNINVASIFQLTIVLPLSLFVLLVHNWLLGEFLCYVLPLLQDLPSFVIMISLMVLSFDRQQQISSNRKTSCVRTQWLLPLAWVLGVLLVLPYIKYITFISLERLGHQFAGGEMCVVNLENNVAPYIRGLFVALFLVPVMISLGLMWTVWTKLSAIQTELSGVGASDREEEDGSPLRSCHSMEPQTPSQELLDTVDIHKEQRAQRFLLLILVSHFTCVLPINVLKLVRHSVNETYENDTDFDLAYVSLVFVTFLPTLILPYFYVRWILIGSLCKELFRLSTGLDQSRAKNQHRCSIFQEPSPEPVRTPRRSSEVENFREEVERQVRERQASLSKVEKTDTMVVETVLLRRASILSTVNDTLILQPNSLQPVMQNTRRLSYEPTHIARKNSCQTATSGKRRSYSVQHS